MGIINSCVVIGAGGIGQFLTPALFKLLKYHPNGTDNLMLIDGDRYEKDRNISRQFVTKEGENKAIALGRRLPLSTQIYPVFLSSKNILRIFSQLDPPALIVPAVDNNATRKLILEFLPKLEIDYIWVGPGNEYDTFMCSYYDSRNTTTMKPLDRYANLRKPTDYIPGDCLGQQESTPQLISANFGAAFTALNIISNLLDEVETMPATVLGDLNKIRVEGNSWH